ncbi:DUF1127 domain-containing protein [Caldimonas brevitalea]|uniref:YjiS-like domain-containing protein n=1 Tax=Caldimonas brevitalea TaxID=413882 RepID=A0A0G3BGX0_9BURK|nr:DUF1127 domain-containing protein [Caldimonas brevitalea]AKJ28694.1 hypothetical protein AAW51_2003 [Caldimonas brevitalea]
MSSLPCPSTSRRASPSFIRRRLIMWWRKAVAVWSRHRDATRQRRTVSTLAELDPRTLRDVGLPEGLRSDALAHREARDFWSDLPGSAGRW